MMVLENWIGILVEGGTINCNNIMANQERSKNSIILCSPVYNSEFANFNEDDMIGNVAHFFL